MAYGDKIAAAGAKGFKAELGKLNVGAEIAKEALVQATDYFKTAEETKNNFLNSYDPNTYEVELLPSQARGNYVEFAQGLKGDVSENSALAGKYSANPQSQQYKDAVKNVEDSKVALKKNYDGYAKYAALRESLLADPNSIIYKDDEQKALFDVIITEEGYDNLVPTSQGLMYDDGINEPRLVTDLGTPKNLNNQLGADVGNTIILDAAKLAKDPLASEELATTTLKINADALTSNKDNAHQMMFYGLNSDPNTIYANHYILNKAVSGDPAYAGITFNDSKGNVISAADLDRDGNGELSDDEKAGFAINTEAFDAKFNELKNDNSLDYREDLNNFLVDMGLDSFKDVRGRYDESVATKEGEDGEVKFEYNSSFDAQSMNPTMDTIVHPKAYGQYLVKEGDLWYQVSNPSKMIDPESAKGRPIETWRSIFGLENKPAVVNSGRVTAESSFDPTAPENQKAVAFVNNVNEKRTGEQMMAELEAMEDGDLKTKIEEYIAFGQSLSNDTSETTAPATVFEKIPDIAGKPTEALPPLSSSKDGIQIVDSNFFGKDEELFLKGITEDEYMLYQKPFNFRKSAKEQATIDKVAEAIKQAKATAREVKKSKRKNK